MATLSKKKISQIQDIGHMVMMEVLMENPLRFNPQFYNQPPENWNEDEKIFWDSLNDMQRKITSEVINLLKAKINNTR